MVFYNFDFSVKYNVYINVKICANVKVCKYISNTFIKIIIELIFEYNARIMSIKTI